MIGTSAEAFFTGAESTEGGDSVRGGRRTDGRTDICFPRRGVKKSKQLQETIQNNSNFLKLQFLQVASTLGTFSQRKSLTKRTRVTDNDYKICSS